MKRENLIYYFIKESNEDHDCEVVAYGLDVIGSGIITFMVLMTIGWISHCLKEALVYIFCHLLVARSTGGYHAATRLRCLGLTTTMCLLIICITDHIWSRISIAFWLNITEIIILMLVGKEVYRHDEREGFKVID